MKTYLSCASMIFCFTIAVCCEATDSLQTPPLNCTGLQTLPVTNLEQRVEIASQGFSVLPPQGEHWCYKLMADAGVSFFKIPKIGNASNRKPSRDEVLEMHLVSAIAMSLKGFEHVSSNVQSRRTMNNAVATMIHEQLFSQIVTGVLSQQHRFRVLESNVTVAAHGPANCVRFNASVEEKGHPQAPNLVFLLNYPRNLVCRHPSAPKIGLIWFGFVERYAQGDKPAAATLQGEYEPYLQSVQFTSLP